MKGLSLPINAVIIIALAGAVLLIGGSFLLSGTGPSMNKIEAQEVFNSRCPKYKCEVNTDFNDAEFYRACQTLYGQEIEPVECLWHCNCGMEVDRCQLNCDICKASSNTEACCSRIENTIPDCIPCDNGAC